MGHVVLVTGVSRDFGGRVARMLSEDPQIDRVVGVDVVPPRRDIGAVRFVRADIRNPVIAKVIAVEGVDTVVHAAVLAHSGNSGGPSSIKEINVIGSMQLLAACQRAPGVRKLVVKSSTVVYGASPRDPAMFSEEMPAKRLPQSGYAKDSIEVEGYVRGFARRRPDVVVTTLRLPSLIGPGVDTALTRYLTLPVVPTVLGFDPRMQFLHESDALAVLRHAALRDVPGVFNVAGDGIVTLAQTLRRLGRPALPLPAPGAAALGGLFRRARLLDFSPEQMAFLAYGRGVDTTRMRAELRFLPRFSSSSALEDFARTVTPGAFAPNRVAGAERRLADLLVRGEIAHG